ncbi:MAG: energy transducer TonB [Candidatus Ancaeobacter aquaticus]|nr:energy transducer TonB [Candidatus Ancaeobacter aquaticus]
MFRTIVTFIKKCIDTETKKAASVSAVLHCTVITIIIAVSSMTAHKYYFVPVQPINLSQIQPLKTEKPAAKKKAIKQTTKKTVKRNPQRKKISKNVYSKRKKKRTIKKKKPPTLKERLEKRLSQVEDVTPTPQKEPTQKKTLKIDIGKKNISNLPFAWYLDVLHKKISKNWEEPSGLIIPDNTLSAVVFFRVYRDGKVSKLKIKEACYRKEVNASVIKAVKDAEPFPPLPPEYKGEYLDINIKFDLNK